MNKVQAYRPRQSLVAGQSFQPLGTNTLPKLARECFHQIHIKNSGRRHKAPQTVCDDFLSFVWPSSTCAICTVPDAYEVEYRH